MSDLQSILIARAPFTQLSGSSTARGGVTVTDRDGLGLAVVLACKGKEAVLAQRVQSQFRLELPRGPKRTSAGGLALAGIGPQAWLATDERRGNGLAASLREALGDAASVADQSDGYAMLRLQGPKVRAVLEKMLPVDVHERAFPRGTVAVTSAGHINATVWRLDDSNTGDAVFEIVVWRSMASDFWHFLSDSAAEFGLATREHTNEHQ